MADALDRARLAVRLHDTREFMRRLFGDEYDEKVEPWRRVVRLLCAQWECSPLSVAPHLERAGHLPEHPLLLIAASVDVAEEQYTSSPDDSKSTRLADEVLGRHAP